MKGALFPLRALPLIDEPPEQREYRILSLRNQKP
jgi:hypothetical protein